MSTRHMHGASDTALYRRWQAMLARCTNPKHARWASYGGRGITVCDRWRDFAFFLADMGEPPPGMTLDRIDNDRGYEPSNCRWTTVREQNRNRRTRRVVLVGDVAKGLSAACEEAGVSVNTVRSRMRRGWSVEDAVHGTRRTEAA